jgi:hypothetical protein
MKKSPPPFGISGSAVWKGVKRHKSATKMLSILKIVVQGWDVVWKGVGGGAVSFKYFLRGKPLQFTYFFSLVGGVTQYTVTAVSFYLQPRHINIDAGIMSCSIL